MNPSSPNQPDPGADPPAASTTLDNTPEPELGGDGFWERLVERRVLWLTVMILSIVSAVLMLTVGRASVTQELNRPLGPTLPPLPTRAADVPNAAASEPNQAAVGESAQPLCNGPEEMIILAIGADADSGYVRGLADVIRLARIDFVTPSVSVLMIPRDLWVPIPGLGEHSGDPEAYFGLAYGTDGEVLDLPGDYGRINASYFYGNLYGLEGGGPGVLAQTIFQATDVNMDHYAVVNMSVLETVIDAVDGIDIDVPYDIEDFSAGYQHMTGAQAVAFARIRSVDNDWYRADRQNMVLLALRERFLEPRTLAKAPALADALLEEVFTDLSKSQITNLICLAPQVEREDIHVYSIGPSMVTSSVTTRGSFVLLPDEEQIELLVTEFLTGERPS